MSVEIPILDQALDKLHGFDSQAVAALTGLEKPHVRELIWPRMWPVVEVERQRMIAQGAEMLLVAFDATELERTIKKLGHEQPSAIVWLTSGFEPPKDSMLIGRYGHGIFKNFLMTDVAGHSGNVYLSRINDRSVLWFQGRAHPNEWENERWANLFISHQYEVIKEHIRRQRKNGKNPVLVTTYLAGAVNGSDFEKEHLAIIGSDMDFNSVLGAGKGPRSVLDKTDPFRRFQAPMMRSVTPQLAKLALEVATNQRIDDQVGISAVAGTPSPTEFQELIGTSLGEMVLEHMKQTGKFEVLFKEIFGEEYQKWYTKIKKGMSFDMGITLEQGLWRILETGEQNFNRIGFVLHSDNVKVEESQTTSHRGNVDVATKTLKRNMSFLTQFLEEVFKDPIMNTNQTADHSLIAKFENLPRERKSKLIDWLVARFKRET